MENKEIKLGEDELNEINDLRKAILENVESIGRLNIKKHFIQKDMEAVDFEIVSSLQASEELDAKERETINKIVEKYGEGQLNFENGVYTKG